MLPWRNRAALAASVKRRQMREAELRRKRIRPPVAEKREEDKAEPEDKPSDG